MPCGSNGVASLACDVLAVIIVKFLKA